MDYKLTAIEWLDSEAHGGWQHIGQIEPTTLSIVSTGFIVKETDDVLLLTTSISANGSAMDVLSIPKCAILNRKDFEWDSLK